MWFKATQNCFWTKDPDLYRKLTFTNSHPSWDWAGVNVHFFPRDYIKYPDLCRKSCSLIPNPHGVEVGVNFQENIFTKNCMKCPWSAQKTDIWQPPNRKGFGTVHETFFSDTALFCTLDPNPKPFVVMWGIRKHEIHAVLYISCNFHKTLFFVIWPNALSHGVDVAKNSTSVVLWAFHVISSNIFNEFIPNSLWRWDNGKHKFLVVLEIPLNFHHECFSWIGTSSPSPCSMSVVCQTSVLCTVLVISSNF